MLLCHALYGVSPESRAVMQWVYPCFAFSVGIAWHSYTRDRYAYVAKMALVGVLAQGPHALFFGLFGFPFWWPNVILSYALACTIGNFIRDRATFHWRLPAWAFYAGYPLHFLALWAVYRYAF